MQRMIEARRLSFSLGAGLALLSAVLFGASTPLAKILLGSIEPWLLAAVLYLGSGVGLFMVRLALGTRRQSEASEAALAGTDWLWLGGAILFGGVIDCTRLADGRLGAYAGGLGFPAAQPGRRSDHCSGMVRVSREF